ncbi:MAG: hypothetical protein G01um1014106_382 [Parcubacteria group bacterium Gr01-1014_106]|nr:MAG: hypothetical protein G01um1014106_382 [Parcubacteria group bacterium Gr01-1014_106]
MKRAVAILVCMFSVVFSEDSWASEGWARYLEEHYHFSISDLRYESVPTIDRTRTLDGLKFGVVVTRETEDRWTPFVKTKISGVVVHVYAGDERPRWILSNPGAVIPNEQYQENLLVNGKVYRTVWKATTRAVRDRPGNLGECQMNYGVWRSDNPAAVGVNSPNAVKNDKFTSSVRSAVIEENRGGLVYSWVCWGVVGAVVLLILAIILRNRIPDRDEIPDGDVSPRMSPNDQEFWDMCHRTGK